NVACTPWPCSRSSTRGVCSTFGPSSNVSAQSAPPGRRQTKASPSRYSCRTCLPTSLHERIVHPIAVRQNMLEQRMVAPRHTLPGVVRDTPGYLRRVPPRLEGARQPRRQRTRIQRLHQYAVGAVTYEFRNAADVAGHDRAPAGQGLDHDIGCALVAAGQAQGGRRTDPLRELLLRHLADEVNRSSQPGGASYTLQ